MIPFNGKNLMRHALRGLVLIALFLVVPACSGLRTKSPGGTVVTHTAAGAGAGALIGWAAGGPGTGAAIGAGVGLLAGAVEADRQSREESAARTRVVEYRQAPPPDTTVVVQRSEAEARKRQAEEYLASAHRASTREDSEYLLRRSLELYPTPEAYNSLGLLQERNGELDRAAETWRKALALDPTYRPARQNLDRLRR